MRHAILIIAHNNPVILKKILLLYDHEDIDFYIHIDKKSNVDFNGLGEDLSNSKVVFVDRMNVYWAHDSQMKIELKLLKEAHKYNYDYYHLISGVDYPLQTKKQFFDFFEAHNGKEFVEFAPIHLYEENKIEARIKYYHIWMKNIKSTNVLYRKISNVFYRLALSIQKLVKVDRVKSLDIPLHYGSNWFSISDKFASYTIEKERWLLKHFGSTSCTDELFLQTLMFSSSFYEKNYFNHLDQSTPKGRYVDWKRGNPYTFTEADLTELLEAKNCLFARKFDWDSNHEIIELLDKELRRMEENEL